MPDTSLTYPGAPQALIPRWQKRRVALALAAGEGLPGPDADLAVFLAARVPDPLLPLPPGASRHAQKSHEIAAEFPGQPDLFRLHGLTIAHLRKRRSPPQAPALFRRMWVEQGPALLALPTRWLISAVITFGDHGATEGERSLGREMGMLFSLMKLYEYERLFSGAAPDRPHARRTLARAPLPMGMEGFSLVSGGLDVNLLAPLWLRAGAEPVAGPPALSLLDRLNADPGTLFRRLAAMRALAPRRRRAAAPET